jgi:formylglycine-generating enzyme required for sulfatase activity
MRASWAAGLFGLAVLASCSGKDGGDAGKAEIAPGTIVSWCQVDDPGQVILERRKRKLGDAALAGIACPEAQSADKRPDELILPMPCGRRMVFRAVRVAIGDALDGERALFGDPDASEPYRRAVTGPWWGEVAGGFPGKSDGSGTGTYYIAKYEVTAPQFAIFGAAAPGESFEDGSPACKRMEQALAAVQGTRVLPAVGMAWHEAIAFADRYSQWLIAQDKAGGTLGKLLPANEARPGYLRLPTEAEWEFAARDGRETGGAMRVHAVAQPWGGSEQPDLAQIAWFAGLGQAPPAGSKVYPVGQKKPNRLQLFDMVGNAEEYTSELFRPVRPDGTLVGRVGGVVARGGGASDDAELVGVGARREIEIYDTAGPFRAPTLGFRLVIAAPIFVNKASAQGEMQGNPELRGGIDTAWARRARGDGTAGGESRDQALAIFEQLRREFAGDAARIAQFDTIQGLIQRAAAQESEREQRSTEEALLTALLAAGYGHERSVKIKSATAFLTGARQGGVQLTPADEAELVELERSRLDHLRERDATYDYYIQTVLLLAGRPDGMFQPAMVTVKDRMLRAGLQRLMAYTALVERHVARARAAPPNSAARAAMIRDLETF